MIWQANQIYKPDFFISTLTAYYYADSNLTVAGDYFKKAPAIDLITEETIVSTHTALFPTSLSLGNATNATTSDRYEIMAYDAEPRSLPLGAIPGNVTVSGFTLQPLPDATSGGLWAYPDVLGGTYQEHPWHSAQFRFDAASQDEYWNEVMKKFSLPSTHNSSP